MKTQVSNHIDIINKEADRCVKCALCAPVCPTYRLTQNESESPRGRIAIAQALAQEKIPLTNITRLHLDHCLTCRACETVCPAKVKYGKLIDHTQAFLQNKQPTKPLFTTHLRKLLLSRGFYYLLRFYQESKLQKILESFRFFGNTRWKRYNAILPTLSPAIKWKTFYPALTPELGRVGLFLGCVGKNFDQKTLLATIKVLTHVGYSVYVPQQQTCCGALDLHAGKHDTYHHSVKKNKHAFSSIPIQAIICLASGCISVLQEYPSSLPIRDISEFLVNEPWNKKVMLTSHPHKVLLHTPCTLANVVKQTDSPQRMLQRIPNIETTLLPLSLGCCGAAGTYFLRYPEIADKLLTSTLEAIHNQDCKLVLTSNIGCQMHLNLGFSRENKSQISIHPIVLLAEHIQLKQETLLN